MALYKALQYLLVAKFFQSVQSKDIIHDPAPTKVLTFRVNCDDKVSEVWFNGKKETLGSNSANLKKADVYTVPAGTTVIGVLCKDEIGGMQGLIGRLHGSSDGKNWDIQTRKDKVWRCSPEYINGWQSPSFTGTLSNPQDLHDNGADPAIKEPIPNFGDSGHIWTNGKKGSSAYCRLFYACARIPNCDERNGNLECTNGVNQICNRCEHTYGTHNAFRLSKDKKTCQQLCSWRDDSLFCYPGTCDLVESCKCAEGFTGPNCLQINQMPNIPSCRADLERVDTNGNVQEHVDIPCQSENIVYTNEVINNVQPKEFTLYYHGPSTEEYIPPPYINVYKVGIIGAGINVELQRGGRSIYTNQVDCAEHTSKNNPNSGILTCDSPLSLDTQKHHGDSLRLEFYAENGGFVSLHNYDDGIERPGSIYYYTPQKKLMVSEVVFDFKRPTHCHCSLNWLDMGGHFFRQIPETLSWDGWEDAPAGIKYYEVEIFQLQPYGDELGYIHEPIISTIANGNSLNLQAFFKNDTIGIGMYCVLLVIEDNTGTSGTHGNIVMARRFFLLDDESQIQTVQTGKIEVQPVVRNGRDNWVTSLANQLHVAWTGRFENKLHHQHKLLNRIQNHTHPPDILLEDREGQPPYIRSMEEIPNINGITSYQISAVINDAETNNWTPVNHFQDEETTINPARQDGDTVHISIRANDVMNHSLVDSVSVFVDSSPPVIENVWLTKDGHTQLAVHNSARLHEMTLEFSAYDVHSGLHHVEWELHDVINSSIIHGRGNLPAKSCSVESPECYRIPKGDIFNSSFSFSPNAKEFTIPTGTHDYDYFYLITVTNSALLQTTTKYQITIDTSPPRGGIVNDGPRDSPDLDYQESLTLHAWWEGFFDKQSGVLFYQYLFSDRCLQKEDFSLLENDQIHRTEETFASITAPGPGRFYVTVVAYNGALDPSPPICSDGVTIDTTPPRVRGVQVQNLWTREGLALDPEGDVWWINRKREKFLLLNVTDLCRENAGHVFDFENFPIKTFAPHETEKFGCENFITAENGSYLGTENKIEIDIKGEDEESGIYDYEVGISDSREGFPNFRSTHGHQHYTEYHPGLGEGSTVYIHIKAINRAGLEYISLLGPVHVFTQPPVFDAELTVEHVTYEGETFLTSHWEMESYDASQVSKGLIMNVAVALGTAPNTQDVMTFTSTDAFPVPDAVCPRTEPPTCAAIPTERLPRELHGNHEYYPTVRVTGVQNRVTSRSSQPYIHQHGAPSPGVVVELPLNHSEDSVFNINQQSDTTSIRAHWFGFSHPGHQIRYQIGLGSSQGDDDVINFHDVTNGSDTYMFTGLKLTTYKRYYTSVIASVAEGDTLVSSDGIIILPRDEELPGFTVTDGFPCSHNSDTVWFGGLPCGEDLDYLISGNLYPVMWIIPPDYKQYLATAEINIKDDQGEIVESASIGLCDYFLFADLNIKLNTELSACVRLCHFDGCFKFECSDGLRIIPDPPPVPDIQEATLDNSVPSIHLAWVPDPLSPPLSFQWTVHTGSTTSGFGKQLLPWEDIDQSDIHTDSSGQLVYKAALPFPLKSPSCVSVVLRSRSPVGKTSDSSRPLLGCDGNTRHPLIVIDAVGDSSAGTSEVQIENYEFWEEADRDFTPSDSLLSAVWPRLWHPQFHWILVSQEEAEYWSFKASDMQPRYSYFNTSSDDVLMFGITNNVNININYLHLVHGRRYHICVYAEETFVHFETFSQKIEEVDSCSNGIVPVLKPPTPGKVWIGEPDSQLSFQAGTDSLFVFWSGFSTSEQIIESEFNSTISHYQYAIGSFPGGLDIKDWTTVGISNMAVVSGLSLTPGYSYYATVKATDFVGKTVYATSERILIDTNPPLLREPIRIDQMYRSDTDKLKASWRQSFSDPESGLLYYRWCLGQKTGHCDIIPLTKTTETKSGRISNITQVYDGQELYFTVQATNRVGLMSQAVSSAVILDRSPPVIGQVLDVNEGTKHPDIDFQRMTGQYHAVWQLPTDPHSPVNQVFVSIGSCQKCGDILPKTDMRHENAISVYHLSMSQGVRYYCTVEACNAAGLCSVSVSDGVMPDFTPPVLGNILDGNSGRDINYQSQRSFISAHWTNMHDVHSGVSHVYYWAGTTPGGRDIISSTPLHVSEHVTLNLDTSLPVGVEIYSTVEVHNHAGFSTRHSSDGFMVDPTPPLLSDVELNKFPEIHNQEIKNWKHILQVKWRAADAESPVREQYISVLTRNNHHMDIPTFQLDGSDFVFVLTNITLSDGEEYNVKVISCNAARLCTSGLSNILKVDNSPPLDGAFALETNHSAALTRHRDGFMTYERNGSDVIMNVSWVGFRDPHTEIINYRVTVGTTYGGYDISGGTEILDVNPIEYHKDEGDLHMETLTVSHDIEDYSEIYISIWAENEAGLVSNRLHGTFLMLPSSETHGSLHLVRRCEVVSCRGHCTCAHQNNICSNINTCSDVTGNMSDYKRLNITITPDPPIHEDLLGLDPLVTRSQSVLSASWETVGDGHINPIRYEWSVGEAGLPPGTGLMDPLIEPVWREAGTDMRATYTTSQTVLPDAILNPGGEYKFYVRAWYDSDTYSVFESDPVRAVTAPPEISRSFRVKDLERPDMTSDIDYTTHTDGIYVSWAGVFRDAHSDIILYRVSLGTFPRGADVTSVTLGSGEVMVRLNAILSDNSRYFASVEAFNEAHLSVTAHSDGFMVDLTPPETGVVHHGLGTDSPRYISTLEGYGVTWRGFIDRGSGIDKYSICLGRTQGAEDILPCTDVGLQTFYKASGELGLRHDDHIFAKVHAYDAVGHRSLPTVTIHPVVIDKTSPDVFSEFRPGINLLPEPSTPFTVSVDSFYEALVLSEMDKLYQIRLRVCLSPGASDAYTAAFGFVATAEVTHHFLLKSGDQTSCHNHTFYEHAQEGPSSITVGAEGKRSSFILTDIRYTELLHSQTPGEGATIHTSVHTSNNHTSVSATWRVLDAESHISQNRWAIGTTPGGTQLQRFESTGQRSVGHADLHHIPHGTVVHVTVVVFNGAGLTTTLQSDAYVIDHTPPHVCCLQDSGGLVVEYLYRKRFTLRWSAIDEETEISSCSFRTEGDDKKTDEMKTDSLSSTVVDLEKLGLETSDFVTLSVRCSNSRGLIGTLTSSRLPVVLSPPDTSSLQLQILPQSLTLYPSRDAHQADTSSILLGWTGIQSQPGITHPQVSVISASNRQILPWTDVDVLSSSFVKISDLELPSQAGYSVHFRLVNVAELFSPIYTANFTVEAEPPVHSGSDPIVSWPDTETVTISWTHLFSSYSSLIYVISVGTNVGMNDILSWTETEKTTMTVAGLDNSRSHYVTITAVNKAGLYLTKRFPFSFV